MYYRNIIAPVDGSELTEKVVEAASCLGKLLGARVILLHVVEKWYRAEAVATDSKEWEAIHDGLLDEGKKVLSCASSKLRSGGVADIETYLSDGDAAYEIIALAHKRRADVIVMGNRRYPVIERFLTWSVVDEVSRSAPCPILWVFE